LISDRVLHAIRYALVIITVADLIAIGQSAVKWQSIYGGWLMDTTTLSVVLVLVGLVIVLAILYRDRLRIALEVFGIKFETEGQNTATSAAGDANRDDKLRSGAAETKSVEASGKRSVALGGSADGATIMTGDKNKKG